jgi:hypothetical protein
VRELEVLPEAQAERRAVDRDVRGVLRGQLRARNLRLALQRLHVDDVRGRRILEVLDDHPSKHLRPDGHARLRRLHGQVARRRNDGGIVRRTIQPRLHARHDAVDGGLGVEDLGRQRRSDLVARELANRAADERPFATLRQRRLDHRVDVGPDLHLGGAEEEPVARVVDLDRSVEARAKRAPEDVARAGDVQPADVDTGHLDALGDRVRLRRVVRVQRAQTRHREKDRADRGPDQDPPLHPR